MDNPNPQRYWRHQGYQCLTPDFLAYNLGEHKYEKNWVINASSGYYIGSGYCHRMWSGTKYNKNGVVIYDLDIKPVQLFLTYSSNHLIISFDDQPLKMVEDSYAMPECIVKSAWERILTYSVCDIHFLKFHGIKALRLPYSAERVNKVSEYPNYTLSYYYIGISKNEQSMIVVDRYRKNDAGENLINVIEIRDDFQLICSTRTIGSLKVLDDYTDYSWHVLSQEVMSTRLATRIKLFDGRNNIDVILSLP